MLKNIIAVAGNATAKSQKFIGGGIKGVGTTAFMGIGGAYGYYSWADKYGTGAAVLMGAAEFHPALWMVSLGVQGANALGSFGKASYLSSRRLNMGKPVQDVYGTIKHMRFNSFRKLANDKAGLDRFLGNEAAYFHR